MAINKKTLKLIYTIDKDGKQIAKSYTYNIANNIENNVAKEVGESFATLVKDDIEDYALTVTETL